MNKKNLLRIAELADTISPEKFDMSIYRNFAGTESQLTPACNSVGCLIGHATILNKALFRRLLKKHGVCDQLFIDWSEEFTGIKNLDEWEYLFSWRWNKADNTPTGAAKRIRYVLEHGFPSYSRMSEEMRGEQPLSYES